MNMLTDKVPETLNISGTEYEINTDYRVWLKFEALLSDENEDSESTLADIKKLIFRSAIPPDCADEEAVEQILWFYRCGKEEQNSSSSSEKEIFSYDYDDGYIYAAFMEQYSIDLNDENRHWWKFRSLMLSLSENTEFVKIMVYRAVEINSKMSASEKAFYQKMKKRYKLPVKKEVKQKYTALEDALINGEPIDSLL